MKKVFYNISVICFTVFFIAGCFSGDKLAGDKRVVAHVNKYKMTVKDLKYELKRTPYDKLYFLETDSGRKRYIDGLLEKEILLQEAQKQNIDKEKYFMKTIENYWEQALLRLLLEREAKKISGSIHVYDNEIEEYYKASGEQLPLSDVEKDITALIKQRKETAIMNAWIQELKKQSDIKVNKSLLEEVILNN